MKFAAWYARMPRRSLIWVGVLLIAGMALVLYMMGRNTVATSGTVQLWSMSPSSQHLFDYYTFSHVIHGFIFYWILWRVARKLPVLLRGTLAIIPEAVWEIVENTDAVIGRYRDATAATDYFGDSIVNSVADVLSMVVGFFLASRLPVWFIVLVTLLLEIGVALLIRDNLTLNIIMLLYPSPMLRAWQLGA